MDSISEQAMSRIDDIVMKKWFFSEPALHLFVCTHAWVPNSALKVPMRCGKGAIEFSPTMVRDLPEANLEEMLRIEVFRIMLKHPYARQPEASAEARLAASNVIISDNYNFRTIDLDRASDFDLPSGEYFEWYAKRIDEKMDRQPQGGGQSQGDGKGGAGGSDGKDGQSGDNGQSNNENNGKGGDPDQGDGQSQPKDPNSDTEQGGDSNGKGKGEKGDNKQDPTDQDGTDNPDNGQGDGQSQSQGQGNGGGDGHGTDGDGKSTGSSGNGRGGASGADGAGLGGSQTSELSAAGQQTELWEEDQLRQCEINDKIAGIRSWGTVPGELIEAIVASTKPRIDYRKVLSGFRASIISSRRSLTRMRPNRRTDFQNMGSLYKLCSRLLVAVDTSGSVSSENLSYFLGVINKFFKYGIESIDLQPFDSALQGEPIPIKKAAKQIKLGGRGGTDFQPVFNMMREHPEYDGLIVFTDGYAPPPVIEGRRPKVVWVLTDREAFAANSPALLKIGRCCVIEA